MDSIGIDLHKNNSQVCILTEEGYAARSRRVKTDRRDARTLAEACKLGAYRPAHRCSDQQRHVRAQLAIREALVRSRTRLISLRAGRVAELPCH